MLCVRVCEKDTHRTNIQSKKSQPLLLLCKSNTSVYTGKSQLHDDHLGLQLVVDRLGKTLSASLWWVLEVFDQCRFFEFALK